MILIGPKFINNHKIVCNSLNIEFLWYMFNFSEIRLHYRACFPHCLIPIWICTICIHSLGFALLGWSKNRDPQGWHAKGIFFPKYLHKLHTEKSSSYLATGQICSHLSRQSKRYFLFWLLPHHGFLYDNLIPRVKLHNKNLVNSPLLDSQTETK